MKFKIYALPLLLLMLLSGCAELFVTGGAIATGGVISDDRTLGTIVDDAIIKTKIRDRYMRKEFNEMLSKITVNSNNGRVLLTGSLTNQDYIVDAVRIAWSIRGVKEVINELKVSDKDLTTTISDTIIKKKIGAKLLLQKDVRSSNYTVDVQDGNVFILGVSHNRAELEKVTKIIRLISGVNSVTNHTMMSDDPRNTK